MIRSAETCSLAPAPSASPPRSAPAPWRNWPPAKVIDVHTHMYSHGWVKAVEDAADPNFRIGENSALIYRGGSIGRMTPPMLDWDLRIKDMDDAKVDVALISLTAPNVYWGTRAQSVAAARSINDDFSRGAAQVRRPHPLVRLAAVSVRGPTRSRSCAARRTTARSASAR